MEEPRGKLITLIDRYLVPIYRDKGIVPVMVILAVLLAFVFFAFYLGMGDMLTVLSGWMFG